MMSQSTSRELDDASAAAVEREFAHHWANFFLDSPAFWAQAHDFFTQYGRARGVFCLRWATLGDLKLHNRRWRREDPFDDPIPALTPMLYAMRHMIPSECRPYAISYDPDCEFVVSLMCRSPRCRETKTVHLHMRQQVLHLLPHLADQGLRTLVTLPKSASDTLLRCSATSCFVTQNLQRCWQCKIITYCSEQCQRDHWPLHRRLCLRYLSP